MERKVNRVGYKRVAEDLKARIEAGVHPVGESLPSYREVAAEYGVSENVARDALYSLRDAGIIDIAAGIGSTVLAKPSDVPASEREQLTQEIGRMRQRIEQVAAEVAELRREVRGEQPPRAPARRAGRPGSPVRP